MAATNHRKSDEWVTAFTVLGVVIAIGVILTTSLLRLAEGLEPHTGDIIAFPASQSPSLSIASFAASRAGATAGTSCMLDVATMQKSGGSLVVEATQFQPGRIFHVHWAGVRTSSDRDDCGGSADLILNSNQISALIGAAGGKGVKTQN